MSSSSEAEPLLSLYPDEAVSVTDMGVADGAVRQGGEEAAVSSQETFSKIVSAPVMIFAAGRVG
jgi:hypothetical protein